MAKDSGVRWPFDAAQVLTPAYAATQTIEIVDTKTIISFAILTGGTTLNLTIDSEVKAGAELILIVPTTATETLTPGTGFTAPAFAGVAGKTKVSQYVYDGVSFKPVAVAFQIN